jgi:hypothetical protein
MNSKILWIECVLYIVIGLGTPIVEVIASDRLLTTRVICAVVITSIVSGCNAAKAFFSTSFSRATGDAILVRDEDARREERHHDRTENL